MTFGVLAALFFPALASAQAMLLPVDRAPYRQRFELQAMDAQYLLLPQTPTPWGEGPFSFHFEEERLQAMISAPPATVYLSLREGGFHLQVLNLRARGAPADLLGPQAFRIQDSEGDAVARGTLLVLGRAPEGLDLVTDEGTRTFESGRFTPVRIALRTHDNYAGELQVLNPRDLELRDLREEWDSAGVVVLSGQLRPLRPEATELRLGVETLDGRAAEISFVGLSVRPPAPRRVRVLGGPVFLDAAGRGTVTIQVPDLPPSLPGIPELVLDPGGELTVLDQRYDAHDGITATLEYIARGARAAGAREVRDVNIRAGAQLFRGHVEVVATPAVSGARAEPHGRALVTVGGGPTLLRVQGQNLDALALDCSPLGPGARCRTLSAGPTELTAEVSLTSVLREGEHMLPLVPAGERRAGEAAVRVLVEYPAIPIPLAGAPFLRLDCRGCRTNADAVTVSAGAADGIRLFFDEGELPAEHGWQRLLVTVVRVRGESRQVVRTFGSPAAPRALRSGSPAGALSLLDASADARHGDLFLIRVEHVAEQYAPEQRTGMAVTDAWLRRVYIDGGRSKRLTGDVVVQPVLMSWTRRELLDGSPEPQSNWDVLYPNAGVGLTWQFLNDRMEPRLFSAKLQMLSTNLQPGKGGGGQPALFLSGNIRVSGTDPNRPLSISGGMARMFGDEPGWRLLLGAGMDLGVARMIFGQ
jgi:hypothetical protein